VCSKLYLNLLKLQLPHTVDSVALLLLLLLLLVLSCSHKDLAKDAAPHFRKAKKFYDGLAAEMVAHGHICDVFSCALDNVSGLQQLCSVQGCCGGCWL
jgi:hypothetical protein